MRTRRGIASAAGAVALAAVLATVLSACSSSNGGTPEPDTVSLPSDLQSGGGQTGTSAVSTAPAVQSSSSAAPANSSSSAPSVEIKPAPAAPVRQANVTSADGKTVYSIKIWWQVNSTSCAGHAYGTPVIQYLTAHPCAGLTRLLATTEVGGRQVGIAESSLGFLGNAPDVYKTAGNFAVLENKDGTGSITDLLRDGYRLPSGPSKLPAAEAFDVESQDSGVSIFDAFYLDGSTPNNDPALIKMCKDVFLQF